MTQQAISNLKSNSMKHKIFLAAWLITAICTVSCSKEQTEQADKLTENINDRIELTVGINRSLTKSSTITDDDEVKVNTLQVFVFRDDALDAYASAENVSEVTLSCTNGERTVYALVNAPDLSHISSKTALLATRTSMSNYPDYGFEMTGSKDIVLPQTSTVTIDVTRIVSRVILKQVTRNFTSPALADLEFKINEIYLLNVAGDTNYWLTDKPESWINAKRYDGTLPELTHDDTEANIVNGDYWPMTCRYYAYPNDSEDSTDENWCPRRTRLVLKTTLGDKVYYYPITLPELEPNKSYEIENLTITRPGSDNPDKPVTFQEATFDINVLPWSVVPVTEGVTI